MGFMGRMLRIWLGNMLSQSKGSCGDLSTLHNASRFSASQIPFHFFTPSLLHTYFVFYNPIYLFGLFLPSSYLISSMSIAHSNYSILGRSHHYPMWSILSSVGQQLERSPNTSFLQERNPPLWNLSPIVHRVPVFDTRIFWIDVARCSQILGHQSQNLKCSLAPCLLCL